MGNVHGMEKYDFANSAFSSSRLEVYSAADQLPSQSLDGSLKQTAIMRRFSCRRLVFLIPWVLGLAVATLCAGEPSADLHSRRNPGQTDRVVVRLEVSGKITHLEEGKSSEEKMSVAGDLEYYEKTLDWPAGDEPAGRSIRDYQKISATVQVGDDAYRPTLADAHRRIVAEVDKQAVQFFSPDDNLTRDELDALGAWTDSLLLDRLLPTRPAGVGHRQSHGNAIMAALLGLDEVAKSTVESTVKEITPTLARFEIAGRVEGAIHGVSTVVNVKGRYRFDRRLGRIDWFGAVIQEKRPSSFVADGVDAVSRIEVRIAPAGKYAGFDQAKPEGKEFVASPEKLLLRYRAADGSWRLLHDRRWFVHHQRPNSSEAVLRLVDRGELSGQCNLASLPRRDPAKLISLEEFQQDVRRALDKNFGEFVEAGQSSNAADYRVLRVVVHGVASEIPMRWIYYHLADSSGRQAAVTFAVEQRLIERFAEADKPIIRSLRFSEAEKK